MTSTHLERVLPAVKKSAPDWLGQVGADALAPPTHPTLRVTPDVVESPLWQTQAPTHDPPGVGARLAQAAMLLAKVEETLSGLDAKVRADRPQVFFDLARARRRLQDKADQCANFEGETDDLVAWIEPARDKRGAHPTGALCTAPIDVGPLLRERVFDALDATIVTSATLTVHGRFEHFLSRVGLAPPPLDPEAATDVIEEEMCGTPVTTARFPSPSTTDARPDCRDFPEPDHPRWRDRVSRAGSPRPRPPAGALFCTSMPCSTTMRGHRLRRPPRPAQAGEPPTTPPERFVPVAMRSPSGRTVLGGVSVPGDALRLRDSRRPSASPPNPSSRHDTSGSKHADTTPSGPTAAPGRPPVPAGFGRLVRTRSDRGAVVVLDRRIASRWCKGRSESLPELSGARVPCARCWNGCAFSTLPGQRMSGGPEAFGWIPLPHRILEITAANTAIPREEVHATRGLLGRG